MRLNVIHSTELDEWIRDRHYLHTVPAGAVLRMEFLNDEGGRIGAMMWGRNPSPKTDQTNQLCLTRMYFVDETEQFTESKALAMARKYIRKHLPHIKGVVAYSSSGAGHEGTVYMADNWFSVQTTRASVRDFRPGRKNVDTSRKTKWVRSP